MQQYQQRSHTTMEELLQEVPSMLSAVRLCKEFISWMTVMLFLVKHSLVKEEV
jgi:hypothetical protein